MARFGFAPLGDRDLVLIAAPAHLVRAIAAEAEAARMATAIVETEEAAGDILDRARARIACVVLATAQPWTVRLRRRVQRLLPGVRCISLIV